MRRQQLFTKKLSFFNWEIAANHYIFWTKSIVLINFLSIKCDWIFFTLSGLTVLLRMLIKKIENYPVQKFDVKKMLPQLFSFLAYIFIKYILSVSFCQKISIEWNWVINFSYLKKKWSQKYLFGIFIDINEKTFLSTRYISFCISNLH